MQACKCSRKRIRQRTELKSPVISFTYPDKSWTLYQSGRHNTPRDTSRKPHTSHGMFCWTPARRWHRGRQGQILQAPHSQPRADTSSVQPRNPPSLHHHVHHVPVLFLYQCSPVGDNHYSYCGICCCSSSRRYLSVKLCRGDVFIFCISFNKWSLNHVYIKAAK